MDRDEVIRLLEDGPEGIRERNRRRRGRHEDELTPGIRPRRRAGTPASLSSGGEGPPAGEAARRRPPDLAGFPPASEVTSNW
jgi:hypothetical protein